MKSSRKEGSDCWLHDKPIAWLWILTLFLGSTYQLQESLPQMQPKILWVNPCVLGESVTSPSRSLDIWILLPVGLTLLDAQAGPTLGVHDIKAKETQSIHPILVIYLKVKGRITHGPVS